MSRNLADIRAAQASYFEGRTDGAISNLPPSYVEGFKHTIDKDKRVTIGPGITTVKGVEVSFTEDHVLSDTEWLVDKVSPSLGAFYYIYMTRVNTIQVDRSAPTYSGEFFYYAHPTYGYRVIGKLFLYGSDIYWCSSEFREYSKSVFIAPDDYLGDADFYVPVGATDAQVYINMAIQYLKYAFGGGIIELSSDTYKVDGTIVMKSAIIFQGGGTGTVIDRSYDGQALKTLSSNGVIIKNMKFTQADSNDTESILNLTGSNIILQECTMDSCDWCINIQAISNDIWINKNVFVDCAGGGSAIIVRIQNANRIAITENVCYATARLASTPQCIRIESTKQAEVHSNKIYDMNTTSGFYGVNLVDNSNCVISKNHIEDILSAASPLPIYLDDADFVTILDNVIINCSGKNAPYISTGKSAITLDSNSSNALVRGNRCKDNDTYLVRGMCEETTAPTVYSETTPVETNIATYARSDTVAYEGTYSWKATGDNGGVMRVTLTDSDAVNHGLIPGLTYKLSAYVYVPTGGYTVGNVKLFYIDTAAAIIYSSAVAAVDTWTLLEKEFTVDTASTELSFGLDVAEDAAYSVYWDTIRLQPIGVHNEHSQNFVDSGTGTQQASNSWQNPFPA